MSWFPPAGKVCASRPNRQNNQATPVRARFVLVVSDLKTDLRAGMGRGAGCNLTRPVIQGVSVLVVGNLAWLQNRQAGGQHMNANGEFMPSANLPSTKLHNRLPSIRR